MLAHGEVGELDCGASKANTTTLDLLLYPLRSDRRTACRAADTVITSVSDTRERGRAISGFPCEILDQIPTTVCTENPIRVDDVMGSLKLAE